MRPPICLLLLLAIPAAARADGCKFAPTGRTVPEREQRAMIAWADGVETLHVAARTDPLKGATVWVVPVRAAATAVRAEPVEEMPAVVYYDTLRRRATGQINTWVNFTALMNSGGLCCVLFAGGCDDKSATKAEEASRVEKLGMVVTVVSAESRAGLERYLGAQGVNHRAADLSSLDPYFGQAGYAFVCGWLAGRGEPVTATGLQIVFPSPTVWFPLRPTRTNPSPVQTVVFARGFVKPADGCDLPDLRCEYVYGLVKDLGVGQTFEVSKTDYRQGLDLEPMTRVTLTTDPQRWDRDLELVPGTTSAGSVAQAVTKWPPAVPWIGSGLIGALVGLLMPLATIRRTDRKGADWFWGALTGAALMFSIWMAWGAYLLWRQVRFGRVPNRLALYLVLPALALAHFGVVAAVCAVLRLWVQSA